MNIIKPLFTLQLFDRLQHCRVINLSLTKCFQHTAQQHKSKEKKKTELKHKRASDSSMSLS
jgi:transposase